MKQINWANVKEATNFERPVPGGYVCQIVSAEDLTDKEYLLIHCDYAEGKYKSYGKSRELLTGVDWGYIKLYRSYKDTALNFFKSFLTAVEKSNPGKFSADAFDGNEKKLEGLYVGVVLCEEEYRGQDGTVKVRLKPNNTTSVSAIREGRFTVPPLKKLEDDSRYYADAEIAASVAQVDASDLPF